MIYENRMDSLITGTIKNNPLQPMEKNSFGAHFLILRAFENNEIDMHLRSILKCRFFLGMWYNKRSLSLLFIYRYSQNYSVT